MKITVFAMTLLIAGVSFSFASEIKSEVKKEELSVDSKIRRLAIEQSKYQYFISEIENLKATLSSLIADDFSASLKVDSSNPGALTATASSSAGVQALQIRVYQLAKNELWTAIAASQDAVVTTADRTLTITVRGFTTILTVSAGTTLRRLTNLINASNLGIIAAAYDTGAGNGNTGRLSLTDKLLGHFDSDPLSLVANLSFSSTLTDLTFASAPDQIGQDAKIQINGGSVVYRHQNLITDLIPFVSLTLLAADPGYDITLTIGENNEPPRAVAKIKRFIEKYNTLTREMSTCIVGDCNGDLTLIYALTKIMSAATDEVEGVPEDSEVRALVNLGVQTKYFIDDNVRNGQLMLDEEALSTILESRPLDVKMFFGGTNPQNPYDGYIFTFSSTLESLIGHGVLQEKLKLIDYEIRDLMNSRGERK